MCGATRGSTTWPYIVAAEYEKEEGEEHMDGCMRQGGERRQVTGGGGGVG